MKTKFMLECRDKKGNMSSRIENIMSIFQCWLFFSIWRHRGDLKFHLTLTCDFFPFRVQNQQNKKRSLLKGKLLVLLLSRSNVTFCRDMNLPKFLDKAVLEIELKSFLMMSKQMITSRNTTDFGWWLFGLRPSNGEYSLTPSVLVLAYNLAESPSYIVIDWNLEQKVGASGAFASEKKWIT